jgi:glycosyltransferase involved in cell wall biosynthesis
MINVISISTDRNIFTEGSPVRARQIEYGALFKELHIIVFTSIGSGLPKKVQIASNVWVYGTASWSRFFYVNSAKKIASEIVSLAKFSAQDTVVTSQDPFETGLVANFINQKFGLPLHVQIHTDFLNPFFAKESLLNRIRMMMSRKVLSKADAVRVVSQRIARSISDSKDINLKPGVSPMVLPIFVDILEIEKTPVDPAHDLRKKYPQFNFIILIASRLTKEKNIAFAVTVFKKLLSLYPRMGLVIVGSGPGEFGLKKQVGNLGIQKNVVFLPWQKSLISYYKSANLFLLTSNYEGYGLTLVESIACRCPVVSTDVGIASQLLQDGITSPVCSIGDQACFFDNIVNLIEKPALREHIVYEARNRLEGMVFADKETYLKKYQEGIESAFDRQHNL